MHFEKGVIRVNIPDPNLYYAIQDYVESHGGYIEMHLNPKILEIRREYMLQLAVTLESYDKQQEILSYVNKQIKNENRQQKIENIGSLVETIVNTSGSAVGILSGIVGLLSPDNCFTDFLSTII